MDLDKPYELDEEVLHELVAFVSKTSQRLPLLEAPELEMEELPNGLEVRLVLRFAEKE